jgi:putative membrane-bound dehydrogenase-like protein
MLRRFAAILLSAWLAVPISAAPPDGNRLTYLDRGNPYYVGRTFPKLVTPQWVGEPGIEAVVVLAIDDMRGPDKWEAYLRPILERLKKIDGRAAVSIMTNQIEPEHPHLQTWLREGVSLETHTFDHPCPLFKGDFEKAKNTYDRCVDLLADVPNNRPLAFRTPCCDSLNTVSPRFYSTIFARPTPRGRFLTLDSSVFNVFTPDDPELPRELVTDADGRGRFAKYLPADRTFVNYVENYPYPYVVNKLCWEFPCVTPSDWQAQHLHKPNNPLTVRDWQAALDCTVIKQGVFCLVFHPHGWIKAEQVVDFIDYAQRKYGGRVKFLTFREAQERLDKNLLGGHSLRDPKTGQWTGTRLVDVDGDGFLDVEISNTHTQQTRRWQRQANTWSEAPAVRARDQNLRIIDIRGDGHPQGIAADRPSREVQQWDETNGAWRRLPFELPAGADLVDAHGRDRGVRFVDIDGDGSLDVIWSNEESFGLYLFDGMTKGWTRKVLAGKRGDPGELPPFVIGGADNGAWFHDRAVHIINEQTHLLKGYVDRRPFNELLSEVEPAAKSSTASAALMKARPGFVVELMAAEPLVQSPIALAFGADGRLWVVEMGDYPSGADGHGKPGGRIKCLESTHADGRYDKATVFLDNLNMPTGVVPWRKGVLITCAPDILYVEDTDGDGKADKIEKLFTGFKEGNPQHRVNGLSYGLDNWNYGANGDSGGKIKALTPIPSPAKPGEGSNGVDIRGRDFRFRPGTGEFELQSGQTQYGRNRDDWGNWFGGHNSYPGWHFALDEHYLKRNPHLAPPEPRSRLAVGTELPPVFPRSRTLPRFNDFHTANRFTSACSFAIYRDDLFGPRFTGNLFVCEPVHNLVSRLVLAPESSTFQGRRALDEREGEFLASADNWCRPTMAITGPDGALWITDMYRRVIEHPEWIPETTQRTLDLRAGHDMGRIYRIYPAGVTPRPIPRLDKLDTLGLVAVLDSPSGWQRDTAQRLLVERGDRVAVQQLEELARIAGRPEARLHALCTLDGLNALKPDLVLIALKDTHPGVRRHGVRLSEQFLKKVAVIGPALLPLVTDADAQVRMQLAYTLGEWDDPRAGAAIGSILIGAIHDRYLTAAALSSVNERNFDAVLRDIPSSGAALRPDLIEELLRQADAFGNSKAIVTLLDAVAKPARGQFEPWQFAALASLLEGLDRRRSSIDKLAARGAATKDAVERLDGLFAAARTAASDSTLAPEARAAALRLLGRGPDAKGDLDRLAGLLAPQTPSEIQAAAIAALGRMRDSSVPDRLLQGWFGYGPAVRVQVLELLGRRDDWLTSMLAAAEGGVVPPAEIDATRRQQWLTHSDSVIRNRAAKLFGAATGDRQKVLDQYQSVAKLIGDAGRGGELFAKHCATCHKLGTTGGEVGPDLSGLGDKPTDYLLTAILDPNRAVETRYIAYIADTKSGLRLTGIIASESGNRVTLVGTDGKQQTLLRSDLDSLSSTGRSLMPEGLEQDLPPQAMADVLTHIKSIAGPPKPRTFVGNVPSIVRPGPDGSLTLKASTAAIHGTTLEFEVRYGNLGHWRNDDNRASWSIEGVSAGRYDVIFEWACDKQSAGNRFLLQAGSESISGVVAGTGSWDKYQTGPVGTIDLARDVRTIELRSVGGLRGYLIDLKAIRLEKARE